MNEKNLKALDEYTKTVEKFFTHLKANPNILICDELQTEQLILGYEHVARPIIKFLNMHSPTITKFPSRSIPNNDPAELATMFAISPNLYESFRFLKKVSSRLSYYLQHPEEFSELTEVKNLSNALTHIKNILEQFHSLSKNLTDRRRGKTAFVIQDEYDVQDMLFLILKAYYPSAYRESTAIEIGKGDTIIDIIIPEHNIVIEVKIILEKAKTKTIVKELKEDFESYHSHTYCKHLIAFIYDPLTVIDDPNKIITDMGGVREKNGKKFDVKVVISPK
jgi:hypothetical protein